MIREQGIGGHFLETDHTAFNFRKEFFMPKLSDRTANEINDMVEAARQQVKEILDENPLFTRDAALCKEIDKLYEAEVKKRI
jgi:trimethylamine:corrinoid methyltransferase-like protein